MNFRELRNHIKNKVPFLVYGDVCRYDPAIHTGDPHEWYRTALHRAEIAVNIEDEAQYWRKQNKLRERVDDLQRELESVRAENARLRAECEATEKVFDDYLPMIDMRIRTAMNFGAHIFKPAPHVRQAIGNIVKDLLTTLQNELTRQLLTGYVTTSTNTETTPDYSVLTFEKLQAVFEAVTPPLYYAVSKFVEPGYIYYAKEADTYPECIIFHPDDEAEIKQSITARRLVPLADEPESAQQARLDRLIMKRLQKTRVDYFPFIKPSTGATA